MIAVPKLLGQFCQIARPIMLQWMEPNSCIAATRVTCDYLSQRGFHAEPVATKFVLHLLKEKLVFTSGLSAEEMKNANVKQVWGPGWNGHLVALINKRWLLDATFDQADTALKGVIQLPKVCQIFSLPHAPELHFTLELEGKFDVTGMVANIKYYATGDLSWRNTPAWNDEGLIIMQHMIHREMTR